MTYAHKLYIILLVLFISCKGEERPALGTGIFTATKIQLSAQSPGEILNFPAEEGNTILKGELIAQIDSTQLSLQKLGLISKKEALNAQLPNSAQLLASLGTQIKGAEKNYDRIKAMHDNGAATDSQLDQAETQLEVLKNQFRAQKSVLNDQNNSLINQIQALDEQINLVEYQIENTGIKAPFDGIILLKTAEQYEYVFPGKPLVEIADLSSLELKAYVLANRLNDLKIGQRVKVYVEIGSDERNYLPGSITWISEQAEFTPKTIQSQDERSGLVYAVKIQVANPDQAIKIGMYGGFQID